MFLGAVLCFVNFHLVQILEMFAYGLQLLLLDANELSCFLLGADRFLRIPTVLPEMVHFLPHQVDVVLFSEFLDGNREVLGHLFCPVVNLREIVQLFLHEFVDI